MNIFSQSLLFLRYGILVTLLINSVGCAKPTPVAGTEVDCGEWIAETQNSGSEIGIRVNPSQQRGGEDDCRAMFTLINGMNYSMMVNPSWDGASIEWLAYRPILVPDLPADVRTTPFDISKAASVKLQGEINLETIGTDLSLSIFTALAKRFPIPCTPSQGDVALVALRLAPMFKNGLSLHLRRDFPGSKAEFSRVIPALLEQAEELSLEYGFDCLLELIKEAGRGDYTKLKIIIDDFGAAVGQATYRYFTNRTKVENANAVLSYVPSSSSELAANGEPTEVPTEEPLIVIPSEPPVLAESNDPCSAKVVITGVDELDLGNGNKLIHVKIGLENTGTMWAKLRGPDDDEDTETQKSVFITTKDRSVYGFLGRGRGFPSTLLPHPTRTLPEERGAIVTALIPPGFSIKGQTVDAKPHYYGFAFEIPSDQVPETLTMRNMSLVCLGPENEQSYPHFDVPETYNLTSGVTEVHSLPSSEDIPDLVGSKLELEYEGHSIEFTRVNRSGNTVSVMFNYINNSSYEGYPGFHGYVIGDDLLASCQITGEFDCELQENYQPIVPPGQTAEGLVFSFKVPENEVPLFFAYVEGDVSELNRVYRLNASDVAIPGDSNSGVQEDGNNPEISSLCQNEYFPVGEGARWIYFYIDTRNFDGTANYLYIEMHNVTSDGFDLFAKDTKEGLVAPLDEDPSATSTHWVCSSDGLIASASEAGIDFLPSNISAGDTWQGIGNNSEITYTALGIESIQVQSFGTYDAMKVQAIRSSEPGATIYYWIAKGVGVVKTVIETPNYGRSEDLMDFDAPTPAAATVIVEPPTSVPTSPQNNSDQIARISEEVVEVNLRRTPGYMNKNNDTDVIVKIPSGELVRIVGGPEGRDGLTWWEVSWNGYEGWIADHSSTGRTIIVFNP